MEYNIRDNGLFYKGTFVTQPRSSRMLSFLYKNPVGRLLRPLVTGGIANFFMRSYMNSRLSRRYIKPFVRRHRVNTDEMCQSLSSFRSFNDFFTRRLKSGARTVDSREHVIVSPADGRAFCIPMLSDTDTFWVKGKPFNLLRFLGDRVLAQRYHGGACVIVRLAPEDYHRYHFPVAGIPKHWRAISGRYDSVQPLVYKKRQPLLTNKRHVIEVQSSCGVRMCMVPVGALCVGRIVETYTPHHHHKKGDEVGYFAFGGSTIVVLFSKSSVTLRADLIKHSRCGYETYVSMGEAIAYCRE